MKFTSDILLFVIKTSMFTTEYRSANTLRHYMPISINEFDRNLVEYGLITNITNYGHK